MFKHYTVEEVAKILSIKKFYENVIYDSILEAVENIKNYFNYKNIYESDIPVIDSYIRNNIKLKYKEV